MTLKSIMAAAAAILASAGMAHAEWKPTKPIEFVVTSGPGGGTDNFARMVQSIVSKHKLADVSIVVTNKGGGSGAEGFVYGKSQAGDATKLIFATNNEYLLPLVAKLAFKPADLTPVAALAFDEFLIWVNGNASFKDVSGYLTAAKSAPLKMGGSQSKDTDQTLTSIISAATGAQFVYVPFKSGGEAAVQLAGAHIDSNVNNPNENIGQWKAGLVRPLCVFSPQRLKAPGKVFDNQGWTDIPTCKEAGLPVDRFQMPRTVWLPGDVPADAVAFYADLMKKVADTPEWAEYIERTSQTGKVMVGKELTDFIAEDESKTRKVFEKEGWIAQ
jgi:putative tricarboxylic transport membrane protein